jgi:hypothetical protein
VKTWVKTWGENGVSGLTAGVYTRDQSRIERIGPDENNGYTWRVTFGSTMGSMLGLEVRVEIKVD